MKKELVLWLDDIRNPIQFGGWDEDIYNVIWVKTYEEFCDYIDKNGLPDRICFDHDLGTEKSGYDAAKYLVDYCQKHNCDVPLVSSQSANPVGRDNILSLVDNWHRFYKDLG